MGFFMGVPRNCCLFYPERTEIRLYGQGVCLSTNAIYLWHMYDIPVIPLAAPGVALRDSSGSVSFPLLLLFLAAWTMG